MAENQKWINWQQWLNNWNKSNRWYFWRNAAIMPNMDWKELYGFISKITELPEIELTNLAMAVMTKPNLMYRNVLVKCSVV